MSAEDVALDEKRVYGDRREETLAYVTSDLGVTRVAVPGDRVGRVELAWRGSARDVAGGEGRLLVAAEEDVLVGTDDGFVGADFGPAVAVGAGADLLAAGPDGRVARLEDGAWLPLGTVEGPRAADRDLVAAASGVHRAAADGLDHLGLADVRDVAAAGPYAATADGVARLADGEWTVERAGECSVVAAGDGRAHAVVDGGLFERRDGAWVACDPPAAEPVADVAYGEAPYAVTAAGTFLVDATPAMAPDGEGGWRARALGLPDVSSIAVP